MWVNRGLKERRAEEEESSRRMMKIRLVGGKTWGGGFQTYCII